ncbi:MAG TPA: ribonuclease domain-containing protein [Tissierellaceae bacterium]|nr:ribonuclease domain-containing protein [Tissierellaceae bacterium]
MKQRLLSLVLVLSILVGLFTGCTPAIEKISDNNTEQLSENRQVQVDEEGIYTSPEEVALYIHHFNQLPKNYITKEEARSLGWESSKGNLWEVTDQMTIGGDKFGNREGLLPQAEGRQYFECDVNYEGGFRGPERLVYSNDGLIFYTQDHYNTFQRLY